MSLSTHLSLVGRLKAGGSAADWELFYQKYGGAITAFARRMGCDDHEAMDVLQETVMVVMRKLPNFDYDPERGRFRNWLLTIVSNKAREARRRAHVDRLVSLDAESSESGALHEKLPGVETAAPGELERNWRQALIESALRRMLEDPRTNNETIEVFRAVALEGRPVAEVALQHGIKENAIYQIKNRMMNRLQALLSDMEQGGIEMEA
ncbi:MAG TPA: hypothetical protein DIT64_05435 [Verrucomicrobiales bacterium]|nr:hypothetical protein [Verrucomicrobiales bacterium]